MHVIIFSAIISGGCVQLTNVFLTSASVKVIFCYVYLFVKNSLSDSNHIDISAVSCDTTVIRSSSAVNTSVSSPAEFIPTSSLINKTSNYALQTLQQLLLSGKQFRTVYYLKLLVRT